MLTDTEYNSYLHRAGITNHQTGQQFVRLLKVLKQIRKLAYWIEILPIWKIHPVNLVVHLEPATNLANDLY